MQKETITLEEFKIVGLKTRTSNDLERNKETCRIPGIVQTFWTEQIPDEIPDRKNIGVVISAYANYESDYQGSYDYILGEEVWDDNDLPSSLSSLSIPQGLYVKLTVGPGPMPQVVIDAWHKIWQMSPSELGGIRSYKVDFELYDERAQDPQNTITDIYIGLSSLITSSLPEKEK